VIASNLLQVYGSVALSEDVMRIAAFSIHVLDKPWKLSQKVVAMEL